MASDYGRTIQCWPVGESFEFKGDPDGPAEQRTLRHVRYNGGERNPRSKLTAVDVEAIREAFAAGEAKRSLADRYGVTRQNISHVINGSTWRGGTKHANR